MEILGCLLAVGIVRELTVAVGAQGARAGRQHCVVCFADAMVAMAFAAFGPPVLVERLLVLAAVKKTGIGRMTQTATAAHARHSGRHGRMIAVTIIAGGRAKIPALQQSTAVNA